MVRDPGFGIQLHERSGVVEAELYINRETAADKLKPQVLHIVKTHQQVARRGAVVSLDHSYRWHYSGVVTAMAKSLSEERERERENGSAKASVSATVAFEDVRRRDQERRLAMEKTA